MNLRKLSTAAVLLSAVMTTVALFGTDAAPPLAGEIRPISIDLEQYRNKLRDIDAELGSAGENPGEAAQNLLLTIPTQYTVQYGPFTYSVRMDWLRDALSRLAAANHEDQRPLVDALRNEINQRRTEAENLAQVKSDFDSAARTKAEAILAAKEFHRVSKPAATQGLLHALYMKLIRSLLRVSGHAVGMYWFSVFFVWTVIVAVSCLLVGWLWRWFRRPAVMEETRDPLLFAASRKSWKVWLREAQEAAERGDFRESVHLAYWAAVSRLEEGGAWPADRTRTPREYLAFLKSANPNRETLLALTKNFELIWYGNRPATLDHFSEARLKVEALQAK